MIPGATVYTHIKHTYILSYIKSPLSYNLSHIRSKGFSIKILLHPTQLVSHSRRSLPLKPPLPGDGVGKIVDY